MSSILIIDDEKSIRKTLTEILSYEGYKIDEAADGEEGLKKFKDKTYDLVLCDIKMPKLDGIEFLEKAKGINADIFICSYPCYFPFLQGTQYFCLGVYTHVPNLIKE